MNEKSALLIKFAGTNCEVETATALSYVGFKPKIILWQEIFSQKSNLNNFLKKTSLLVFPGGFSYGDNISAGEIASQKVKAYLFDELKSYINYGGHILGICNGFQILCKIGLLNGTLEKNKNKKFICKWLKINNIYPKNPFLMDLPSTFELPIACAEGLYKSQERYTTALKYKKNYFGTQIAGVSDETGKIFGLMPHPERFLFADQHPDKNWSKKHKTKFGWGYNFFNSIYKSL